MWRVACQQQRYAPIARMGGTTRKATASRAVSAAQASHAARSPSRHRASSSPIVTTVKTVKTAKAIPSRTLSQVASAQPVDASASDRNTPMAAPATVR